jgi:hypothetical protein
MSVNPEIGSLIDSYTVITRKLWSLAKFQRFIIPLTYHMLETENAFQNYNNYDNYFGIC